MDNFYRDVYTGFYRRRLESGPDAGWVSKAIDKVDRRLGQGRLRADAKYLLLVTFTEMIVQPIRMRNLDTPWPRAGVDLEAAVSADIELLVMKAALERRSYREVSGHAVIDALSKHWKKLRIAKFDIWE
jgi:hypothetical protein